MANSTVSVSGAKMVVTISNIIDIVREQTRCTDSISDRFFPLRQAALPLSRLFRKTKKADRARMCVSKLNINLPIKIPIIAAIGKVMSFQYPIWKKASLFPCASSRLIKSSDPNSKMGNIKTKKRVILTTYCPNWSISNNLATQKKNTSCRTFAVTLPSRSLAIFIKVSNFSSTFLIDSCLKSAKCLQFYTLLFCRLKSARFLKKGAGFSSEKCNTADCYKSQHE